MCWCQALYKYGARRFVVFGLGKIGSIPLIQSSCGTGTNGSACVDNINNAVELFNVQLLSLVVALNNNLTDASFIYINSTGISSTSSFLGIISSFFGFQRYTYIYIYENWDWDGILHVSDSLVSNASCCEASATSGLCEPLGSTCSNRSEYLYWDSIHPTEIVASVYAERAYKAEYPSDAYPFDISHLVQLGVLEEAVSSYDPTKSRSVI